METKRFRSAKYKTQMNVSSEVTYTLTLSKYQRLVELKGLEPLTSTMPL